MRRVTMSHMILFVAGIALLLSGCIGQDNTSPDDISLIEDGVLIVGTEAQFPPFEIKAANGVFYGFDIALAEAIADELGLDVRFIDSDFSTIIESLNSDKFDVVISAMTITEQGKECVNFSDPYFEAGLSISVPFESDITGLDDLAGKTIGVQMGTTGDVFACSLEGVTIIRYARIPDAFTEMRNGGIDAIINDDVASRPYVAQYPGEYRIIEGLLTVEQYGIAVPKDNPRLLDLINDALQTLRDNGTYDEIFEEYIVNWSSP
ncbi:MAG: basic amino acid ABC transporter substrate-binding protein [Candidatus Methanofastidiosa archaeon]|nr:basic amino acid ABC transporter substrate-binding protein [Candidatus Methanofastidiosa archaeon]